MEVGAVEDGSRLIRTDKAVVFRDIVGVVGPGGAARARCTCAVEVGVPVRVDATETGRDGQGRGVGVGVEEWGEARGEGRGAHRRGHAEQRGTSRRACPSSGRRRSTSVGRRSTWPRAGGTTASLLAQSSPAIAAGATSVRASRGAATRCSDAAVERARVGAGGHEADGAPRSHGKRHGQRRGGRGEATHLRGGPGLSLGPGWPPNPGGLYQLGRQRKGGTNDSRTTVGSVAHTA